MVKLTGRYAEVRTEVFLKNTGGYSMDKLQRVAAAREEKGQYLKELFHSCGLYYPAGKIYIRILKAERILEIWAWSELDRKFVIVKSYMITCSSGDLGPKRREGDMQVPEGFYHVNRLNPQSRYYLSLKIDYPNESDMILGDRKNIGGDIFIHGGCRSIGCIPIGDDAVKEVYLTVLDSDSESEKIPVHIFPANLNDENFERLRRAYGDNKKLIAFWENLKEGYKIFEKTRILPGVSVNKEGKYIFNI